MLLVIGASGFLGSTIANVAAASGRAVTGTYRRNAIAEPGMRAVFADLGTLAAAESLLAEVKPDVVINCAAFTNVDGCETDPETARLLNAELPATLGAACAAAGVRLAHISTDSVFDGSTGGYAEDDVPEPLNVYAQTKLAGERALLSALPDALVIRTNFVGRSPDGRTGLADWLRGMFDAGERISGFTDVIFGPLLTSDLARVSLELLDRNLSGIYHASARDAVSKYDFARRLGTALGADTSLVDAASIADAALRAPRPLNTSLSPARVEATLGRRMSSVDSAVAGYAALVNPPVAA